MGADQAQQPSAAVSKASTTLAMASKEFQWRFGLVIIRRRQQTGESPEEMLTRLVRSLKNMSCKKKKSKQKLSRSHRAKPHQGYKNSLLKC